MSRTVLLEKISQSLSSFTTGSLEQNAIALLETLGYRSTRRLSGLQLSADNLAEAFNSPQSLRPEKALTEDWQSVHLLFQLTDEEISSAGRDPQIRMVFDSASKVDPTIFRSYLFFAVELKEDVYTRGQLAGITREINRLFPTMPVMVLFQHGQALTLAIIHRRPHKKETEKDVLEKVTLIKDIRLVNPHRAHLEILADLALDELYEKHHFTNFLELHQAWQETLNISELNKRFYSELANWYFWAVSTVRFPAGGGVDEKERNAINVIRLITRLIFVWFIREKGLVPEELFDRSKLEAIINFSKPEDTIYYKAVLQNLFFATLNVDMNKDTPGSRAFAEDSRDRVVGDYLIANKYRYREMFKDGGAFLKLCADIPFLNGGLFECLDREISADELTNHPDLASRISKEGSFTVLRVDGFSRRKDNVLHVPDMLFFSSSQELDLNEFYGTQGKHYKVCGLFPLLSHYKFTVEENTPIEEEVALDPELLGKVFENLLAAYNPETGTTARKQTGSFYTPREIVNYMVDEALVAYLETALTPETLNPGDRLRSLLAYEESPHDFQEEEIQHLIQAIEALNSLDPACGSGAFPMGLLHKLVHVLQRLDPDNTRWRDLQKKKAVRETGEAYKIGDHTERQARLLDIEDAFTHNTSDYGRKLYLIENCIYGVDIQPIAVQIAKLRFFISLVVEQKMEDAKDNRGIRPLPNLETKFVAANTLIGIEKPGQQGMFRNPQVVEVEEQLREIRHKIFSAGKSYRKRQYRQDDEKLRKQLAALLKSEGWGDKAAAQLASWDPYDQNSSAGFFDPKWMFGVTSGFDVVIGNPPYVGERGHKELFRNIAQNTWGKKYYQRKMDLFYFFFHFALDYTKHSGQICFISTNYFITADGATKLRRAFRDQATIRELINFNEFKIFESALGQHNLISLLSKGKHNNSSVLTCITKRQGVATSKELESILNWEDNQTEYHEFPQSELYDGENCYIRLAGQSDISSNTIQSILNKVKSQGQDLGTLCNINQGILTGVDKVTQKHIAEGLIEAKYLHHGVYILDNKEISDLKLLPKEKDLLKPLFKNVF